VVLDARKVEVGEVAAVVDDPLRVGVGEADARLRREPERRLLLQLLITSSTSARLRSISSGVSASRFSRSSGSVFDDLIEVYVRMARIGRTSATFELAAYRARNDVLMVTAKQTLVLVDLDERKAVPIPQSYKDAIRAFEGETLEA
jgi:hypothetical protein